MKISGQASVEINNVLYDLLYLWCRDALREAHLWPPAMPNAENVEAVA